ncbi:MAG: hypothetical protein L6427_06485 [Actinomycetia bacterium]|nr:hypothetical protein [Actinomycetes bacterium]
MRRMRAIAGLSVLFMTVGLLLGSLSPASQAGAGAAGGPLSWFAGGNGQQGAIKAMASYGVDLYAGTLHWTSGCEVWCYDGSDWTRVAIGGFGDTDNKGVVSMAVFNSELYAGTLNWVSGCEVWRYDGTDWTRVQSGGFGSGDNHSVSSMAVFGGALYAGLENHVSGCQVWRSADGSTWNRVSADGFGDGGNADASSMAVHDSMLYVGTFNPDTGCEIWSSADGATCNQANDDGFSDGHNGTVSSLRSFKGKMYAGTWNNRTGCEVWRRDGPNPADWTQLGGDGFGNKNNVDASSMSVFDSCLHVGTYNHDTGCGIWRSADGDSFQQVNTGGFGDTNNLDASSMATHGGSLYVGVADWERGCEMWRTAGQGGQPYTDWAQVSFNGFAGATWYVAEGSTYGGFETWILVQNPGSGTAHVTLTYMTGEGEKEGPATDVPPGSRVSVNVADTVESFNVSTEVNSDKPVVVERALYYNCRQCATGSLGATCADTNWYVAEGSTYGGFETWILVQNPGSEPAEVNLMYYTDSGMVSGPIITVQPGCRETVNVADTVETFEVSTEVTSDNPVVVERALYYNNRQCATGSVGATGTHTDWYVAEGSTYGGFETWILVQNPGSEPAEVNVTYQTGWGEVSGPTLTVGAGCRESINVADTVETYTVSTQVTSDNPVVVERALYYDNRQCATGSLGAGFTGTTWYVAEGSTYGGFETWILVQNPGEDTAHVTLTYMTGEGEKEGPGIEVAPGCRVSVNIADTVDTYNVSTQVTSDKPVVVERALYYNERQCATGSVGFDVN